MGVPLRATEKQNNAPTEGRVVNSEVQQDKKQEDNITQIERLAKLRQEGILTQEEFERKKQELLQ